MLTSNELIFKLWWCTYKDRCFQKIFETPFSSCCSRAWKDLFFFFAWEDEHEMGKGGLVDVTKISAGVPRYISYRLGSHCLHKGMATPISRFHPRGSSTMVCKVVSPFLPHTLVFWITLLLCRYCSSTKSLFCQVQWSQSTVTSQNPIYSLCDSNLIALTAAGHHLLS